MAYSLTARHKYRLGSNVIILLSSHTHKSAYVITSSNHHAKYPDSLTSIDRAAMEDTHKTRIRERDIATEPNISNGQVLETSTTSSHTKLKSRHLYMIATEGQCSSLFLDPRISSHHGSLTTIRMHRNCISRRLWQNIEQRRPSSYPRRIRYHMLRRLGLFLFEIAAFIPLDGAAPDHYITRFLSNSFGFTIGWNC